MSRSLGARWACLLALAGAGCQDYNFNPVGRCLIQPGSKQVTLSSISSADVLFVVDDSGSMGGEQQKLADNFDLFIKNLDASNEARAAAGLLPFDFHIAVTTTSVFWNYQTGNTCTSTCTGAAGQLVCCKPDGSPARQPVRCTPGTTTCPTGTTCGAGCAGFKGENVCCNQADGTFPTGSVTATIPCGREGTICGGLETHYDFGGTCKEGVAVNEWPFPGGDFVSWTGGAAANPRVLHFDKELYTGSSSNKQGFTRAQLLDFFKGGASVGGNVLVGTCGSGEEQALAAARLAIEKATSGRQKDTYARTGTGTPLVPQATWDAATRTAGSPADFLATGTGTTPSSKLVLVFVGDEDDCSSPQDPSAGVVMLAEPAGQDACVHDATTPPPVGQKETAVQSFVDYFTGLGRPVGAAFIFPAAQTACSGDTCTPGLCCDTVCTGNANVCSNETCGAQAAGTRLYATAGGLRTKGADVVLGSICDPEFGTILDQIAELVKPPSGLVLPSQPAANEVTLLRIASSTGATRKLCAAPLAPASYPTLAAAQATGADWWFTEVPDVVTVTPSVPQPWNPVSSSRFVYINPKGSCIANPGETYSSDYLGRLPDGGCWDDPRYAPLAGETVGDAMCRSILGGAAGSWTCFASASGGGCATNVTATSPGTCLCGSRADNCSSP